MSDVYDKDMNLEEDTQHGRFLTFTLEDEVYGIEIRYVTEIIGIQPITKVPEVLSLCEGDYQSARKNYTFSRYEIEIWKRTYRIQ